MSSLDKLNKKKNSEKIASGEPENSFASYSYYDFFSRMIECACDAANELHALVSNYDRDQMTKRSKTLHELEHKADFIKHGMLERLMSEFLPPIDRDDIIKLSYFLDDIVDSIDDVAHGFYMYDIRDCRADVIKFTEIVITCCEELAKIFSIFEKYKKNSDTIKKGIVEVNRLEGEGDRVYTEVTRKLFTDGTDAISVCAWNEIYRHLETCCDACEHTADAIEAAILKNY